MNCASARCSRARSPRRNVNRAPESLAAVAKSSRPSASPRSAWSLRLEIERARRAPAAHLDVVVGGLARPASTGMREVRQFEQEIAQLRSARARARARAPSARRRAPATSRSSGVDILALAPLAMPICLRQRVALRLQLLRARLDRLALALRALRSAPMSSATPRLASAAATAGRSLRKQLMSSIERILAGCVAPSHAMRRRARRSIVAGISLRPAPASRACRRCVAARADRAASRRSALRARDRSACRTTLRRMSSGR